MSEGNDQSVDVRGEMARGAAWMVAMRWCMKLMGFVNVIILARLLTPQDFGLVAMAMILVGFVTTVTDGSFDRAILRDKDAGDEKYHAAWTVQILAGLLSTILVYVFSPVIVSFFSDDRLYLVLFIAGLRPAILGFENIGQLDFRRYFDFRKEFRYWIWRQFLGIVIGLSLAIYFRNYLALTLAMPLSALAVVALSYVMSSFRPRFSWTHVREIVSFSKWFVVLDTARYAANKIDELVVGRIGSASILGHYYMASDLSTMPTRELVMPLERAMVPALAHISENNTELRGSLLDTLKIIFPVCLAAGLGLFLVAESFVLIILGAQWLPAVPFFEWLALYGVFSAFVISVQSFFVVSDRFHIYCIAYSIYAVGLILALYGASQIWGLNAIAPIRTACAVVLFLSIYAYIVRMGLLSIKDIWACAWRPFGAALAMVLALRWFQSSLDSQTLLTFISQISLGATVWVGVQFLLWYAARRPNGVESEILSKVKPFLHHFYDKQSL